MPAQVLDHTTGYLAAAAGLLALAAVRRGEPPRTVHLSLAQTAQWLLSAGQTVRQPPRDPDPDTFLVTLPGAATAVHVVRPPSRVGDLAPHWSSTSELGAHPPYSATRR